MALLLFLFIVVPALELVLLIRLGGLIGALNTFAVIVATGMIGAALARQQGLGVLQAIRTETAEGRLPAAQMVDGLILLIASALLVTPGILTDAFGFLCLMPAFRTLLRERMRRWFEDAVREGRVVAVHWDSVSTPPPPRVYDVTPESPSDDEPPVRRRLE